MAKLATVAEVIARLSMPASGALNAKVATSLDAASLRLEMALNCNFLRAQQTEYFAINCNIRPLTSNGITLMLKNGFMQVDYTPTVLWAYRLDTLQGAALDGIPLPITVLNPETALLYVQKVSIPAQEFYASVQYSSGFVLSGTAPDDVYQGVPTWLKELAITEAINVLLQSTPCGKDETTRYHDITSMLGRHARFDGAAYYPFI